MTLSRQLKHHLIEIGSVVGAIGILYGVWIGSRRALGYEDKSINEVIKELKAEDITDRTRDSVVSSQVFSVKYLTESNTILLCAMADSSIRYNNQLPCKRLLRERGIE